MDANSCATEYLYLRTLLDNMSKQTNVFQKLILYIHEALEGKNAKVTESAMLSEQNIQEQIER